MLVSRGGDFQSCSVIAHTYYRDLYDIGCRPAYRIVAISRRYGTLKHLRFPLLLLSSNKTSAYLNSAYVVGPTELETCNFYYLFHSAYNPRFTCRYSTGYLQDLFLYKCFYVCLFAQLSLFLLRCILECGMVSQNVSLNVVSKHLVGPNNEKRSQAWRRKIIFNAKITRTVRPEVVNTGAQQS